MPLGIVQDDNGVTINLLRIWEDKTDYPTVNGHDIPGLLDFDDGTFQVVPKDSPESKPYVLIDGYTSVHAGNLKQFLYGEGEKFKLDEWQVGRQYEVGGTSSYPNRPQTGFFYLDASPPTPVSFENIEVGFRAHVSNGAVTGKLNDLELEKDDGSTITKDLSGTEVTQDPTTSTQGEDNNLMESPWVEINSDGVNDQDDILVNQLKLSAQFKSSASTALVENVEVIIRGTFGPQSEAQELQQ